MRYRFALGAALAAWSAPATHASGINGINNGMPNRISMNVTVPRQTQGATFGEKVNAGLQAAGSVVAQGASLTILAECGDEACAVVFPDGDGFRADTTRMTVQRLEAAQSLAVQRGTALGQGASLLGGALPGGAIVSAAVSSVGTLGASAGAAAASYARGTAGAAPAARRSVRSGDARFDVPDVLADGQYVLTLVLDKGTKGLKDTLKTQVRVAAPPQVEIVVGFSVEAGTLKARHDTALNAVRNLR